MRGIGMLEHITRLRRLLRRLLPAEQRRQAERRERRAAAYKALGSPDIVRVDYARAEIHIRVTSEMERLYRTTARKKEPWTIQWLDSHVHPGDVLYDIGANVGVFSLIAGTRLAGDGTVVAFEPGYANYARLCENIVLNDLADRIVPVPLPLSSRTGLQTFTYRSLEPGQSRHRFTGERWEASGQNAVPGHFSQSVLGIALDEAVALFGLPRPTLVKLDVDGAELQVLEGARSVLGDSALRGIVIEIDHGLMDPVVALLTQFGFRLVESPDRRRPTKAWYGVFER